MSVQRTRVLGFALALAALGAGGGCGAYATITNVPVDCSVEDAYDFEMTVSKEQLSAVDLSMVYNAGDTSAGATITTVVDGIPEGALCGAIKALEIKAHHYDDWGALAGFYGFTAGMTYRDESAFEGLSYWARAPGPTGKGYTIELNDANTFMSDTDAGTTNCTNYGGDGGNVARYDSTGMLIPGTGTTTTPANACGNGYTKMMTVTGSWQFYLIPFDQFHQSAMPNRLPNDALPGTGLLTDKLMGMVFRMPRGEEMDLWITKLGFYRKKGSTGSTGPADAGAD